MSPEKRKGYAEKWGGSGSGGGYGGSGGYGGGYGQVQERREAGGRRGLEREERGGEQQSSSFLPVGGGTDTGTGTSGSGASSVLSSLTGAPTRSSGMTYPSSSHAEDVPVTEVHM